MSDNNIWKRMPGEPEDAYLFRLGSLRESGKIPFTWGQITMIMNASTHNVYDESTWRKRFRKMGGNFRDIEEVIEAPVAEEEVKEEEPDMYEVTNDIETEVNNFDAAKMLVRLRDEKTAMNRMIRSEARKDAVFDLFRSEIHKYDSKPAPKKTHGGISDKEVAVYALLSDIHYGSSFVSAAGSYNSDIASERVMSYADKIIEVGLRNGANVCYVSLLGDMISGIIHTPMRIENRENAVEQIVGVSELVADFLYKLSDVFDKVYVNSVSGNHSRLDMSAENALRAEKLDALIPWYCKAKLSNISNVQFVENEIDPTVCSFTICGKNFIGVHGDMDRDLMKSAMRLEHLWGKPVDYLVSGHYHTPNLQMEDRVYIRNGSVVGSGDDFTMRNRLFGSPSQVCMTVTEDGVQSVWPVAV